MAASTLTKTHDSRRWHVLGAGSIGSLFAAYLQRANTPVSLLPRQLTDSGQRTIDKGPVSGQYSFDISLPSETDPINFLLVTTKAYDVYAALQSIQHRLQPESAIILLVNGMGFQAELAALNQPGKIYFATTTEGAFRSDTNNLTHAGSGVTRVGCQGEPPTEWFADWPNAIPNCQWDDDIDAALWLKLAINCAINPLTALENCLNGELGESPELRDRVATLCAEIATVAQAAGHQAVAKGLQQQVFEVIRGTSNNRSSMLQDHSAGRRTEIDYLTGYLVKLAETLEIAVPENRQLLLEIKAHE
ncbi:MAG: 2-dehydropantoate 2-reductase [Halieaceae bacterium]